MGLYTHTHTHTHTTSDLENKNKERNNKVIRKKTVITAVVILVVIIIASSVCAGLAFARNEKAKVQESAKDGEVMQSTQVAEAEPASQGEQGAQTETIIQTTQSAQTDAATQSEQGTQASELVDNENMTVQTDIEGKKVPVPRGYVGSQAKGENEISKGYVIYEGEEPVTDANVAEAQKTRNQYVWVPVPDVSKMYGTDSSGKKWGKLYSFSTSSTGSNYDATTGAYPLNWSETNGVMSITRTSGSNSYREPDILTDYDDNRYLKQYGLGPMTRHDLLLEMQKDFNNMINSVKKYGGFYIGRYETGNLSQDIAVVQKGNTDIASQTWYAMYKKCKKLKGANKQVETGMIWGSQWDRTLMWLVESGNKSIAEICDDSTSWGNYWNNLESGAGSRRPTGYSETWKANNIYDLAGNVYEWTLEACLTYGRVYRGGDSYSNGAYRPADYRNSDYPSSSGNVLRC